MNRFTMIILLAVTTLLAGCSSTIPSQFYTLSSSPIQSMTTPSNISISVGPVSIPAAVDRPQIVVRTEPNRVSISEFNRWAAPLKGDIARVIAENLISMLGTPQVTLFPQSPPEEASYRVVVHVLRFESEPGKAATLDALWKITSGKDGQSVNDHTIVSEPTQDGSYAELVGAHSRALSQLSLNIATAIREMEGRRKKENSINKEGKGYKNEVKNDYA